MMLLTLAVFWQVASRSCSFKVTSNDVASIGNILCKNQYEHYCDTLGSDKCYAPKTQELCCRTCAYYENVYEDVPADLECQYGDRYPGCPKIPQHLCYYPYNQYVCCASCYNMKSHVSGCEYGDRDPKFCSKIKPHHCYVRSTEQKCCYTCSQYNTGKPGCEYGDRNIFIEKNRRKYNCEAYVGHFGKIRCAYPWDKSFRYSCCESCGNYVR